MEGDSLGEHVVDGGEGELVTHGEVVKLGMMESCWGGRGTLF